MNLFTVTSRMRRDFRSFLPRAACAFEVFTNLLAAGTGRVEVFLRVAFDLRRAAPPYCDFVTELAHSISELRLIDRCGKLLGLKEASFLQGTRFSVSSFGDVEDNNVCMKLRRDIAIDWAGRIVFKLGGYKLPCRLGGMIAADAGLCVVFELVERHANALPVRFADTLIAADWPRKNP